MSFFVIFRHFTMMICRSYDQHLSHPALIWPDRCFQQLSPPLYMVWNGPILVRIYWDINVCFLCGKFCGGSALSIHSHQQSASSSEFRFKHDCIKRFLCLQMYLAYHLLLQSSSEYSLFLSSYEQIVSSPSHSWLVDSDHKRTINRLAKSIMSHDDVGVHIAAALTLSIVAALTSNYGCGG